MSLKFITLIVVTIAFAALSILALLDVGYWGIIAPHFQSFGAGQVFADLVILALLSCVWMVSDSKKSGLPAWPFIILTLVAGSFGVLFYLMARERNSSSKA